jgi:hypothetical protein
MQKRSILLPLGDDSQKEKIFNRIIKEAKSSYDIACADARVKFANTISHNKDLPLEVKTKVMELVGNIPYDLPDLQIVNTGRYATMDEARSIMGEDFISYFQIAEIFSKFEISTPESSTLRFLVSTLERAKEFDMVLVYQPMLDGKVIGLDAFANMTKNIVAKDGGALLYTDQFKNGKVAKSAWFADKKYDAYREQQKLTFGWRLATKSVVENTTNKTFVAQIVEVCKWLDNFYKDLVMPEIFQKAIAEIRQKQTMLENLQNGNTTEFLKEIQTTLFWKNCMENGLETLFRLVAYNQVTGQKLLYGIYTRNSVVEPVAGEVGNSGFFYGDGAGLNAVAPRDDWSLRGLVFSCNGDMFL